MSARRAMRLRDPITRRSFLRAAAVAGAGAALPWPWLSGCGGGDDDAALGVRPLEVDPSLPWWLQNNFDPVFEEIEESNLEVRGSIPPELDGLYVRNGSNPQNADTTHWFFGDGMLHAVRLENGRALWYRNRYIRTEPFLAGASSTGGPPAGGNNQSNVSAIYHAGRLLTSGEVGAPYEIDPTDLSTIGVQDFDGGLNTSFTAHSKIDPATGFLHFFGYWFIPPHLTYHVLDERGRLIWSQDIETPVSTMMHSFAITDRDAVFWDLPVVFDVEALVQTGWPFRWDDDTPARIGLMPLGGAATEMRWVEIEPCYVFHELNAYRDGGEVVIDVCRYERMMDGERFGSQMPELRRWRVGTGGDALTFSDQVLEDREMEFPVHDRRRTGRENRYGWFTLARSHAQTVDLAGIARRDQQSGALEVWDPGPGRHAGEAFFVAAGDGESDGWLLSYVYDRSTESSVLAILDAGDVSAGPVAQVDLPRRVPFGFHGVWIPRDPDTT